jgi:hypothetical protein
MFSSQAAIVFGAFVCARRSWANEGALSLEVSSRLGYTGIDGISGSAVRQASGNYPLSPDSSVGR